MTFQLVQTLVIPGTGLKKLVFESEVPGGKVVNITTVSNTNGETTSDSSVFVPGAAKKNGKEA